MEGSNQKFQVQIETGAIMEAELITVVEIDSKEYAVYSIDNQNGTVDILASYVEKDEEKAFELYKQALELVLSFYLEQLLELNHFVSQNLNTHKKHPQEKLYLIFQIFLLIE